MTSCWRARIEQRLKARRSRPGPHRGGGGEEGVEWIQTVNRLEAIVFVDPSSFMAIPLGDRRRETRTTIAAKM